MAITARFGYSSPTVTGGSGTLSGSTQPGQGPYGGVPKAPSPGATQAAALSENLSRMDQIKSIMDEINRKSAQDVTAAIRMNLPGYEGAMGQAMGDIQSGLRGQLPPDVISLIQQQAAERGVAAGIPGSQNVDAAYLRALGLTSLGQMSQAQGQLTNLMGAIPRAPLMDPSSLLVTPAQQQEWQYLANMLAAAPDPTQAALTNLANVSGGMGQAYRGPSYGGSLHLGATSGGGGGYGPDIWHTPATGGKEAGPAPWFSGTKFRDYTNVGPTAMTPSQIQEWNRLWAGPGGSQAPTGAPGSLYFRGSGEENLFGDGDMVGYDAPSGMITQLGGVPQDLASYENAYWENLIGG